MNSKQYQHGDVTIEKIEAQPKEATKVSRKNDLLILAEGETTGHAHAIADKQAIMYELKGELYLEALAPVTITHEEHKPMTVPTGIYKIGHVQEYDPDFEGMTRRVLD